MARATAEQLAALNKVARLRDAEERARFENKMKAKEFERSLNAEARGKTNDAIAHAHFQLGIPKTQISTIGLGSSDRKALYARFEEIDASKWVPAIAEEETGMPAGLTVELSDDTVSVHFLNYFNTDIAGEALTGTIVYSQDGEVDTIDLEGDGNEFFQQNPLGTTIIWGLPAVQRSL